MENIDWSKAPEDATHWVAGVFTKWVSDVELNWSSANERWIESSVPWSLDEYVKRGVHVIELPDNWKDGLVTDNPSGEYYDAAAESAIKEYVKQYIERRKPDVVEHGNDNKYSRKIKTIVVDGIDHDIYVDVYDVLTAFKTTNPANDHAIKKQLATGQRGVKGVIQDLTEARDSLNRAIEIEQGK